MISASVSAARPDGAALFSEKLVIEPAGQAMRQTGVMDSFDVFANVILLTPRDTADRVHARVDADVDLVSGVAFGACRLPNDAGLIFKVLGRETAQVKAKVREFWAVAREEAAGAGLPPAFSGADRPRPAAHHQRRVGSFQEAAMKALLAWWERLCTASKILRFVDLNLRGIGQVMFQNNPLTGLLFFIGIGWGSYAAGMPQVAIGGLVAWWRRR